MIQVLVFIIKPQHPFSWHAVSKFFNFPQTVNREMCYEREDYNASLLFA